MKRFKKLKMLAFMLILSCVTSTLAIPVFPAPITAEAATIKLNKQTLILNEGSMEQLKLKGAKKNKITWKSNKPSVATVDNTGLVSAEKKGKAKITAKVGSKKYTCAVTVENPHFKYLSGTTVVGYGFELPLKGTTQKVKWSSSNKSVATVSSHGIVFGRKVGRATITAKVNGDEFHFTIKVIAPVNDENDGNDEQVPEETNPPQTEPSQTEPPQTETEPTPPQTEPMPPQTEPEETEPSQTEPPQTEPPQTETEPPQTEPPQTESEETKPELPEGLEGRLLMMSAYGLNAAYNAAKFPSTLHLNRIVYDPDYVNVYGDKVVRMVVCCYAKNSLGGYNNIYVLMLGADSNKNYENSMSYDSLSKTYFTTMVVSLDPGTDGDRFSNKKAVDAYNQYLGDTYGRKNIPYD